MGIYFSVLCLKPFTVHSKFRLQQVMSCLQVFCITYWSSLCQLSSNTFLFLVVKMVSFSLSPADWLWRVCTAFILFILHQINFTLAPPSIPSASPLPSPNPDSSFLLEIMSIICLRLPWVVQEIQYLSTYKRKIFPVHHHILFSPHSQGSQEVFGLPSYLWYCACLLTCVDSAVGK